MSESKRFTRGRAALAVLFASAIAVPAAAIAVPPGGGGTPLTPTVIVANDATKPVPVSAPGGGPLPVSLDQELTVSERPAGDAVSASDLMQMQAGETNLTRDLVVVPEGKRLIVEYVNGSTIRATAAPARLRIQLVAPGEGTLAFIPLQLGGDEGGITRGLYSLPTRIILDGPNVLQAQLARIDPSLTATITNPIKVYGTMYDCETCTLP